MNDSILKSGVNRQSGYNSYRKLSGLRLRLMTLFVASVAFALMPIALLGREDSTSLQYSVYKNVLECVLNSHVFRIIHPRDQVYVVENELFNKLTPFELYRDGVLVQLITQNEKRRFKPYILIGDFTIDHSNPSAARVMIEMWPDRSFNVRVVKVNNQWRLDKGWIYCSWRDNLE